MRTVLDRTGLSRSTLYRKMRDGTFPNQVRISEHCCGWRESAINRWIADPVAYTILQRFQYRRQAGPWTSPSRRGAYRRPSAEAKNIYRTKYDEAQEKAPPEQGLRSGEESLVDGGIAESTRRRGCKKVTHPQKSCEFRN
jgi:prophage regulatory protein